MARLEDLQQNAQVAGVIPGGSVTVVNTNWHGADALTLFYQDENGRTGSQLLDRGDEARLEITERRGWRFSGDGSLLRLVSEATRIRLAYLFDPLLAVSTSDIEPLPHQITAVYDAMLPRQPLRFLLADDPGAGKTIMAGLLMKELRARGDALRCLLCVPGNLVEQWQDEMQQRFGLAFSVLTRDMVENAPGGNVFTDLRYPLLIGRLDQMARNEDIQARLHQSEWDLIVCDEAHKMSAHYYGREKKTTRRYDLGMILGGLTRHLLLMTATPHSGSDEDFGLFLALLDPDRFEGRLQGGEAEASARDLMRRMVKEDLVRFDSTPLFPERWAYTVAYELSPAEQALYEQVTAYVTNEMNRADRLREAGQGRRGNNVGFALTVLQRRLASSPEAIYRSLERRRKKLEAELLEWRRRGTAPVAEVQDAPDWGDDEAMDDYEDRPDDEIAEFEEEILDRATAAQTVEELAQEIASLRALEAEAKVVRNSRTDRKWEELSRVLQDNRYMFDEKTGARHKLIIFTEHRDTLNYLVEQIGNLLGRRDAVLAIHGGLNRLERKTRQDSFLYDKHVLVLVATDAAGEGVNLQRAHLVVNYDLPWNPNRIEQRFGRVHRIGQTEVCHLWNLVASQTREGAVYQRLLEKLERESQAMGGKVFDVLGQMYAGKPLRQLLIEAIRYGEDPEVRERLFQQVESPFDPEHIQQLLAEYALAAEHLAPSRVQEIRERMERAEALRLQPHFVREFFRAGLEHLGGRMRPREKGRWEVVFVPARIRHWDGVIQNGQPILERYERICFEREYITLPGKPLASLVAPGHPLLDAVIDLLLRDHADLMREGAILVDKSGENDQARALVYLEHSITDGRMDRDGRPHVVSRRMEFIEIDADGNVNAAGPAPYLNYEPLAPTDCSRLADLLAQPWLADDLETKARSHAIQHLVPEHFAEVRSRVEERVDKTVAAVKDRLIKEINYWDGQKIRYQEQERNGRANATLNAQKAKQRADELHVRLTKRLEELAQEKALAKAEPLLLGAALVVPQSMLEAAGADARTVLSLDPEARKLIERKAMEAVMAAEAALGREPVDVGVPGNPWDVESRDPESGELFFIEVKGRTAEADTICVTKNEILTARNKPDHFILAIVQVEDGRAREPAYIRQPFNVEPDFGVTSVNFRITDLLTRAQPPS